MTAPSQGGWTSNPVDERSHVNSSVYSLALIGTAGRAQDDPRAVHSERPVTGAEGEPAERR